MKYKISFTKIILVLGLIIYRLLVDIAYEKIIAIIFDYQYFFNSRTSLSIIISWIFLGILIPFIIKILYEPKLSSNIISVLILISLVPTTTLIAYNSNYNISYVLLIFIYWVILLSAQIFIPTLRIYSSPRIQSFYWGTFLTLILGLTVLYISYTYTGFRFHFGLMDVYDIRTEARGYSIPFFLGYLSTFADNILPILLVFYMCKSNWLISIIISVLILLNFGITGTKQILFLLILAIFGFFFIKSIHTSKKFVFIFTLIPIACLLEFNLFSTFTFSIFSLYRIFFIPAKLHYVYFNFFSNNEVDYFRQSALKWLVDSPYKDNIGFIIGNEDIGEWTARANNGLFSDAFLNLGSFGVFVFPIFVILLLKFLEGSTKAIDSRLKFIIIVSVSFILLGMTLTTSLFTSGLLVIILFFNILPKSKIYG